MYYIDVVCVPWHFKAPAIELFFSTIFFRPNSNKTSQLCINAFGGFLANCQSFRETYPFHDIFMYVHDVGILICYDNATQALKFKITYCKDFLGSNKDVGFSPALTSFISRLSCFLVTNSLPLIGYYSHGLPPLHPNRGSVVSGGRDSGI